MLGTPQLVGAEAGEDATSGDVPPSLAKHAYPETMGGDAGGGEGGADAKAPLSLDKSAGTAVTGGGVTAADENGANQGSNGGESGTDRPSPNGASTVPKTAPPSSTTPANPKSAERPAPQSKDSSTPRSAATAEKKTTNSKRRDTDKKKEHIPKWKVMRMDADELEQLLFSVRRQSAREKLQRLVTNLKSGSEKVRRAEMVKAHQDAKKRADEAAAAKKRKEEEDKRRWSTMKRDHDTGEGRTEAEVATPPADASPAQKKQKVDEADSSKNKDETTTSAEKATPPGKVAGVDKSKFVVAPTLKDKDNWVKHHQDVHTLICPDFEKSQTCPLKAECDQLHIYRIPYTPGVDPTEDMTPQTREDLEKAYQDHLGVTLEKSAVIEKIKPDDRGKQWYSSGFICPVNKTHFYPAGGGGVRSEQKIWWYTEMKTARNAAATVVIHHLKEIGAVPKNFRGAPKKDTSLRYLRQVAGERAERSRMQRSGGAESYNRTNGFSNAPPYNAPTQRTSLKSVNGGYQMVQPVMQTSHGHQQPPPINAPVPPLRPAYIPPPPPPPPTNIPLPPPPPPRSNPPSRPGSVSPTPPPTFARNSFYGAHSRPTSFPPGNPSVVVRPSPSKATHLPGNARAVVAPYIPPSPDPSLPNVEPWNWMERSYAKRCQYFQHGKCRRGVQCFFAHVFHPKVNHIPTSTVPHSDALNFAYGKNFNLDLDDIQQNPFHSTGVVDPNGNIWYAASFVCPVENTIYYAAGGQPGRVNGQNMFLYPTSKDAILAVSGVVLNAFSTRGMFCSWEAPTRPSGSSGQQSDGSSFLFRRY